MSQMKEDDRIPSECNDTQPAVQEARVTNGCLALMNMLFESKQEELSSVGLSEDKRVQCKKKKITRISLADAYRFGMGGKSVPLQQMHLREQQPLSPNRTLMPDPAEEEMKERSARFKTDDEEDDDLIDHSGPPSDSESEDEEAPDQEPYVFIEGQLQTLASAPIKTIETEPMKLFKFERPPEFSQLEKDKLELGYDWKEEFTWDLVAREIALARNSIRCNGGCDPRIARTCWQRLLETGTRDTLEAELEEEVETRIQHLHVREWDEFISNIDFHRKKDKVFDARMAFLIYYNDDISDEERERRWNTLMIPVANRVIETCNADFLAPKPLTWHLDEEPKYSEEEWQAVDENWARATEAIQDIPGRHLEKMRKSHNAYWGELKANLFSNLRRQLEEYKCQNDRLGWSEGGVPLTPARGVSDGAGGTLRGPPA
jgi:hypothetical protein